MSKCVVIGIDGISWELINLLKNHFTKKFLNNTLNKLSFRPGIIVIFYTIMVK